MRKTIKPCFGWNRLHDKLDQRDAEIKRLKKRISELEGKRG